MSTKIIVYKTIVMPHFNFCATLLYQAFKTNLDDLQLLQNRAMRCILRCNRFAPVGRMLLVLDWLSISQWLTYQVMLFMFKLKNGMLPGYLSSRLIKVGDIHKHGTRNANAWFLSNGNKSKGLKSIFYLGVRQFNDLPNVINKAKTVRLFKIKYLHYIKLKLLK